jgi:cation transport regulator ChaC
MDGYSIQYTTFHRSDGKAAQSHGTISCLVYIGLPSNPQFLGVQDPDALASHILKSYGPSGENREYLYMLEESLLHLSVCSKDWHISDLANRCRAIEARKGPGTPHQVPGHDFNFSTTEEQEEIEKEV